MPTVEPQSELIPDPSAIAAVVAQLVEGTWPGSDAERENLFERVPFKSGERLNQGIEGSSTTSFALVTELPGISFASWSTYNGKFMSINLHAYSFPEAESRTTRLGHDAVCGILTDLYGQPTRLLSNEEVPPSTWKVNGREIDLHFFNRRNSSLMLSVSDSELAAATDAEAAHDSNPSVRIEPSH
ncbi:hypothetical protein [Arthrobacter livingstonensis]|uniref:hypothetical protein n=1 Tax=Arthrobacter livingstonensis TaxID=670078 RepID=UPI0011B6A352|nr:hypothetical protein [Arthrobacter livingstonensis]